MTASLVAGSLAGIQPAEASSEIGDFSVTGTVASATLSPGDVFSEANLNPLTDFGPSVAPHYNTTDGFTFNTSAARTTYAKQLPSGRYVASDFQSVLTVGATVKVNGDRITNDDGTVTFLARKIYNPPPAPSSGAGSGPAPSCEPPPSLDRVGRFVIVATIIKNRVHVPCTNLGGLPSGFVLSNPLNNVQPRVDQAYMDYNGRLDIFTTPLTEYYYGSKPSTYDKVVKLGRVALVRGHFVQATNGWVFAATRVVAPYNYIPPASGGTKVFKTYLQGARQNDDVDYTGSTFGGPNYSGPTGVHAETLTFTGGPLSYGVSGTFSVSDSASSWTGTIDNGFYDNQPGLSTMDWSLTITGGTGHFAGCSGTGTFDSDSVTTGPVPNMVPGPQAFTGALTIYYTCP
ncbi:MAG TPA: hypothetical protein VNB24_06150 [Acidimicrobiales bacterium]|nr:hypothetical protein [Acidimicrobiales bacterium]